MLLLFFFVYCRRFSSKVIQDYQTLLLLQPLPHSFLLLIFHANDHLILTSFGSYSLSRQTILHVFRTLGCLVILFVIKILRLLETSPSSTISPILFFSIIIYFEPVLSGKDQNFIYSKFFQLSALDCQS